MFSRFLSYGVISNRALKRSKSYVTPVIICHDNHDQAASESRMPPIALIMKNARVSPIGEVNPEAALACLSYS